MQKKEKDRERKERESAQSRESTQLLIKRKKKQ